MSVISFKFCVHFLFVFANSIHFATCFNQMSCCNRGKTDGKTKKVFLIWNKTICKFFRRFVSWKTRRKQTAKHKKPNQKLQVFVLFFLFCLSLRILTGGKSLKLNSSTNEKYEYGHLDHWYMKLTLFKRF